MPKRDIEEFIAHWSAASPSERANSQPFLLGLCDILEVPRPDNHPDNGYFFEYPVTENHADGTTTTGRIDLYRRGRFVLESKQFQEAKAEQSQLEIAAVEAGVIAFKKSSQPVRGTGAWDEAMIKARGQAERYVRALPNDNPPFVIVVDVGHSFEVFADFSQAGKAYLPFPDPRSFRIRLADLADPKIRERLRLIWTDPAALDPAKRSADVTREVSGHLAELAKSLEEAGHEPDTVAQFLTRCLFCMFAEDVELLPKDSFSQLLESIPDKSEGFQDLMRHLFREMNTGTKNGISVVLRKKLLRFNGGLFADDTVLPLNDLQLGLLKNAARQSWGNVEPAIFGTLLERALDPKVRHKLGAHYTPRAYVERLVLPTVIDPLRAEWESVRTAAFTFSKRAEAKSAKAKELTASSGLKQKAGNLAEAKEDYRLAQAEEKSALADQEKARAEVNQFHDRLCNVTVLDPACGSGNFLYVALQHLKILEAEILDVAAQFGENFKLGLESHTIDPHQFLGIEINPRAAAIAELVLWIGYLQWHFKLHGKSTPPEPILRAFKNIQCRDAVLEYDGEPRPVTWAMALENPDVPGLPDDVRTQLRSGVSADRRKFPDQDCITVWDRRSKKTDPVTQREVPDETKRVPLLTYTNPRPAKWPEADFIVGNPPFIGTARMREDLGDGYAETLRATYPDVPESADFVLYWWHKAAVLTRTGFVTRFGLITTNSLRQTFARRVVQAELFATPPLSLLFAVPDHPWVDTADGAAVRIAMTVGAAGEHTGELLELSGEESQPDGSEKVLLRPRFGKIQADLTCGAAVNDSIALKANEQMSCEGVKLHGMGFVISIEKAKSLGLGKIAGLEEYIRPYLNGRDLASESRGAMVIDLFGLTADETRERFPEVYQHVLTTVKPERDANNRATYRDNWWIFGEPRREFRPALSGLPRYIATIKTSKHRVFQFLDSAVIPDSKLIAFPFDDAYFLGVLSSRVHCHWALAAGSWLGFGNDPTYVKSASFEKFPFPLCGQVEKEPIRKLAEELDTHRKRVQAQHGLTLTGIYNILEKIRAHEKLSEKEQLIHEKGLVSVLKQLHDDLDAAVFAAYGWPTTLSDAEILERLVALNAERAAEEKRGIIHWLRPDYQLKNQAGVTLPIDLPFSLEKTKKKTKATKPKGKATWPKSLAERVQAVETALHQFGAPAAPSDLATQFKRAQPADVAEILETLVTLGRARKQGGKFSR